MTLVDTRAYDGCISVEVLVDQDNSDEFIIFMKWSSRPKYEKYFAWRNETGMADMLEPVSAAPIEIRHYDVK